jgi:DNA-binding NtrC family response regulator
MRQGAFRQDLFYRLSVVVIPLPPLRERREDIPSLVHFFLRKHGLEMSLADVSIHPQALELLLAQPWPGNVRELENVVRKVLLSAQGYTINEDHVRAALAPPPAAAAQTGETLRDLSLRLLAAAQRGELADAHAQVLRTAERELVTRAIELAHGNQAKAARWLGVSRLTLREKLRAFGLHPDGAAKEDKEGAGEGALPS